MKKILLLTSLMIAMLLVMVSVVSATSLTANPDKVKDTSSYGTYYLNSGERNLLTLNDGNRYESHGKWQSQNFDKDEYIDFYDFDISIPNEALIDSVMLNFDWHRDSSSIDGARIQVWDGDSWHIYDLTLPSSGVDQLEEIDLTSYIDESNFDDLKIRFQAHDGSCGNLYTDHDLVEIVIEYHIPVCELEIYNPEEGDWFDSEAVEINWNLTAACTPIDEFDIWYEKDGDCEIDQGSWMTLESDISPGETENPSYPEYHYIWDRPAESGQYCVKIKVSSNGARSVSGKFNVDLAPPVVSLDVGDEKVGECGVDEEGDCYVNQDTPITISCDDGDEPWQSGVDSMEYRYSWTNGTLIKDWTEVSEEETFSFEEDSEHLLEYRCYDKVGKKDEGSKTFIVDSVGPEFVEKTIGDPQYCEDVECDMYVTQDTEICVTYEDPQPHPVGGVVVYCEATVKEDLEDDGELVDIDVDENGCFTFDEDSYHAVHCWAEDALKNHDCGEDIYEQDIVDTQAPETILGFEGPYYFQQTEFGIVKWIDTVSNITLEAEDPEPHPVGLDKTYYRYETLEDDSWCYGTHEGDWTPTDKGDESWMEYEEPFGLPESCHVVEYYSEDLLGNSEDVHVEFVFSDHTEPLAIKEVGKPSHNCNGPFGFLENCEDDWDYIITMQTPVTLSCEDQEPHPSGIEKLCWRMEWDETDVTHNKCSGEKYENGWCCEYTSNPVDIYFDEECVHLLEFYCVDNVNKTSDVDSEIFKVEGTDFTIDLDKKWNLISFPFNLLSSNVEEVFSDIDENIEGVWSYEDGAWKVYIPDVTNSLNDVVPGRGYWVKTSEGASLLVGGELFSEGPVLPSAIELDEGWNLIGHYGLMPKRSYCSLFSLVDTQEGHPRWSSLWGYDSASDHFIPLNSWSWTRPGQGYWLEMDVADYYAPSTTCWGMP